MSEHKTLHEALCAVQAEVGTLPKDAVNPHFRSKFTPLDTIVEHVAPVLAKHGLTWSSFPCFGPNGEPALRYKLTHATSGDSESEVMPLLVQKPDPQGQGSGITYARRYSLSSVLNLVSDEDDDGNAGSRPAQGRSQPVSAAPAARVTAEDIRSLKAAAKGLGASKIKLAFGTVGLSAPRVDGRVFDGVPREKAGALAEALSRVER